MYSNYEVKAINNTMKKTKIVILGGGFGGTYTFKYLHKYFHKNPNVQMTIVSNTNYFLFTPLLHEVATGGQSPENIVEPIRKVLGCCLSDFQEGHVTKIDRENNIVDIKRNDNQKISLPYDYLVFALGSSTKFFGTDGAAEHAFTLKTLEDAQKLKRHILTSVENALHCKDDIECERWLNHVIIGGGPTGVELAAEMHELLIDEIGAFYPEEFLKKIKITLCQSGKELVPGFPKKFRDVSYTLLRKKGITVLLNEKVISIDTHSVTLSSGEKIQTYTPIWVAGVQANVGTCFKEIDLEQGKVSVNDYLQSEASQNIYALGDAACFYDAKTKKTLPPLAQVATHQAKTVAHNIYASIEKKKLKKFVFKSQGTLMSIGKLNAVADIGYIKFTGAFAWWLWRTIYLSKLLSFSKKLKTVLDWTLDLFGPRDISKY